MSVSTDQITAVVLAGGFGTRIKHLLGDLPKPMARVHGKPFLEWVLRYLAGQGIRRTVLSTGYRAEAVEHYFQSQSIEGFVVQCVPETKPLGTAGGFLNAAGAVGEKRAAWLVLNGDSLAMASLDSLVQSLADPGVDGAILGVPMPDASRYGTIIQNEHGMLAGFQEKRAGQGVINAGVYLFRASAIGKFPQRMPLSFETDVFPALVALKARIKVCAAPSPFLDIGTPESLPLAEAFIREHPEFFRSAGNSNRRSSKTHG